MVSQLKWGNKARTGMLPSDGSFQHGDARWCGYVDLATHIAKNPKKFTEEDKRKAFNILFAEGMRGLATQVLEDSA